MKTRLWALFALFVALFAPVVVQPAQAEITIQATTHSAPNVFGSPSFNAYLENAKYAMLHGLSAYGPQDSPTGFQVIPDGSRIDPGQFIVSNFPLWRGDATPEGLFAGELGNRLTIGFLILGNGELVSPSRISFTMDDQGPLNLLDLPSADFPTFGQMGSYQYGSGLIGFRKGPDGVLFTADDIITMSGANTHGSDALWGFRTGNGAEALSSDPGATNQDKYDGVRDLILPQGEYPITAGYTYTPLSGPAVSDFKTVTVVPEPATAFSLIGGMGMLLAFRRRK